jgi:hypothetical protein
LVQVLSWINSNLTTNPNHMSKVSAQNGNWNKAKFRLVLIYFFGCRLRGLLRPPLGAECQI